jgi:DNA uptake protein ComE-like DNA-binding protein
MMIRRFLAVVALVAFAAAPALAETAAPKSTPPATQKKAPPATAPATIATKVNLNSANAEELDKLPQIGPARAKSIIDARAKGRFKDWNDFVARKVVPANAERAIKDLVSF